MSRGGGQSTRFRTVLLAGALTVAAAGAAAADTTNTSTNKVIGEGVRLKGTSVWYAHGTAVAPRTISTRVVAIPAQAVKVQWSVVCQKPNKFDPAVHIKATGTSGEDSVHAAATVQLDLPYPKPHTCIATVYATLANGGRLTLRILQT